MTHFQRQLKNFFQLLLDKLSVRVDQLQITVHHSSDRNGIPLIQILPKSERLNSFIGIATSNFLKIACICRSYAIVAFLYFFLDSSKHSYPTHSYICSKILIQTVQPNIENLLEEQLRNPDNQYSHTT